MFTQIIMVFPRAMTIQFIKEYERQHSDCPEYETGTGERVTVAVEGADFGDGGVRLKAHNTEYDPASPVGGSDSETILVRVGGTLVMVVANTVGAPVPSDVLEKLTSKAVGKVLNGG